MTFLTPVIEGRLKKIEVEVEVFFVKKKKSPRILDFFPVAEKVLRGYCVRQQSKLSYCDTAPLFTETSHFND